MFDAFPYQKYGAGRGTVTAVSRVPIEPSALDSALGIEEPVFRIRVAIDEAVPQLRREPAHAAAGHDAHRQSRARAAEPVGSAVRPGRSARSRDERMEWPWSQRMQPLLQSEAAECGLACDRDGRAPITATRSIWPACRQRYPDLDQGRDAGRAGRDRRRSRAVRRARCGSSWTRSTSSQTPAILHWDLNHFVVLEKRRRADRVTILDPATGRRTISLRRARPPFHRRRARADADDELRADRGAHAHPAQRPVEPAGQLSRRRPPRS